MTRAVLIGATGRMGAAIVRASAAGGLTIVAAVASPGSKSAGLDVGELAGGKALGVRVQTELPTTLGAAEVAIDFSRPELTLRALEACRTARVPLVIGTTGHDAAFGALVDSAARDIAVLVAPNTSVGVAVAMELVRIAARALPAEFAIEIVEAHHRYKVDAPSGTALALAGSAARARGLDPAKIGIASVREGEVVGTHTVLFAGSGERLTIGHEATDRSIFAQGAVRAAAWLAGQKPGRYTMGDLLGLKTSA